MWVYVWVKTESGAGDEGHKARQKGTVSFNVGGGSHTGEREREREEVSSVMLPSIPLFCHQAHLKIPFSESTKYS